MNGIIKTTFLLGICLIIIGCSNGDNEYDSIEGPEIQTELLYEIRDSEEILFEWIADVKVISDDLIAVLDLDTRIHLFDGDGNFLNTSLKEGKGPGEVQWLTGYLGLSEDNTLIIHDQGQRRMSVFEPGNSGLSYAKDINLEPFPTSFYLNSEGNLALYVKPSISNEEENDRVSILDMEGNMVHENFLEFDRGEQLIFYNESDMPQMAMATPHHPKNIIQFSQDKIIHARSDELGFSVYDLLTGELINQTKLTRPDFELPTDERREFVDDMIERIETGESQRSRMMSDMPKIRGKVGAMHYDPDGKIWLNILEEDQPDWLIFDESGELTGTFTPDFEGEIVNVQKGQIFIKSDDENGAPMLTALKYPSD
ncbi:MAG: 6-bladed beta-propeller [Balneolaceae bacterium]